MSYTATSCESFDIEKNIKVSNPLTLAERKEQKQKYKIFSAFIDGLYNIEFPEIQLTEGGIFKVTDKNRSYYTKGDLDPSRMKLNIPFDTTQPNSKLYNDFFEKIDELLQSEKFLIHLFGSKEEYEKKKNSIQYSKLVRNPADKKSDEDDDDEKSKSKIKYKNIKLSFKLRLPKPDETHIPPSVLTKIYVVDKDDPDNIELLDTDNFLEIEKYIGKNAKVMPTVRPISIYLTQTAPTGKFTYGIKFVMTQLIITDRGTTNSTEQAFSSVYGSKFKIKNQSVKTPQSETQDILKNLLTGSKTEQPINSKQIQDEDDIEEGSESKIIEESSESKIIEETSNKKKKKDKKKNKKIVNSPKDSDEEEDSD